MDTKEGIMKKFFYRCFAGSWSVLALVLLLVAGAGAQQVEVSSTLNPVGSGARAMGMGGAFISVADDATAASWNPAGLIHLEKPEISVVGSYFSRTQAYHSDIHPEIETKNTADTLGLNYASAAYPFVFLKHNMIFSLNYQRLYEMDKKVDFNYTWDISGNKLHDSYPLCSERIPLCTCPGLCRSGSPATLTLELQSISGVTTSEKTDGRATINRIRQHT